MDSKKVLIGVIILILINIAVASATEVNDTAHNISDLNQSIKVSDTVLSSPENEEPEYPDLVDKDYTYVYQSTIDNFFEEGVLKSKYKDKNLIFSGDFENIGVLEIDCDNVTITGFDTNLKNTEFLLTGHKITLNNLNFNLNTPEEYIMGAGILVVGNDITLVNLTINYNVPKDVEAYAIYAEGYDLWPINNLKIINSTIYFEGHNDNVKKYNCALKLSCAYDAFLENNTIYTSLPLKEIDYGLSDASLNSAYVYSVGIEGCDRLIFNNNTIIADVNKRPAVEYPTLDCMVISKSNDVTLSNNSIFMTDFVTYPGVENYLYGIDVHNLKNLWIVNNSVSIVTTGGKYALGTAYPIQISGPISGVVIEYNDLYSFSNGPNIGIYSQCYFGQTYLSIRNNKINVTGLAGTHDWALVTGIESQDTFAEILNNQIEVHSIDDVGKDDNLFAISYRQSINGPNSFDIENNVAFTDGYYAVYILNSQYSSIINNTLISFNDNVNNGDDAYRVGPRKHYYEDNYDNKVIRAIDYFSAINQVDNNNIIEIGESSSSNVISANTIPGKTQENDVVNNPLIPSFNDLSGNIPQENDEYIDDGSVQAAINDVDDHTPESNTNSENQNNMGQNNEVYGNNMGDVKSGNNVDGRNINVSNVDGNNLRVVSNSSSSIGVSNNPVNGRDSASSSSSQSVSKKAYELEEMVEDEKFIHSVFLIIIVLILLIIGYKRKSEDI